MAKRMPRVNSLLKKTVSDLLFKDVRDPRVARVVVTEVKTAPDLASAIVYYSLFGTPDQQAAAQAGLDSAAPFIQSKAGRLLQFHFTPRLKFVPDESIPRAERIERLLKGLDPDAPAAVPPESAPGTEA
ncbi:MAG TPA: 30S ribosome-binding factor RbfA [bacterium]|nr:30S ribosome-binding factor RbfA [bacterium]